MELLFILFVAFLYFSFKEDINFLKDKELEKAELIVVDPLVNCPACEGDGFQVLSCCGDNIKGNDIDLCPTCFEHTGGDDDREDCEDCEGTGLVKESTVVGIAKYSPPVCFDEDRYKYND